MATLLELRQRVRSVKNIRQITRAMKMVSAAKLRRSQERMLNSRPYSGKMWDVLGGLAEQGERSSHPLLERRREDRITAVVITSDRGLCAGFNANALKYAHRALRVWDDQSVKLVCIGRKGYDHFRRRSWPIDRAETDLLSDLSYPRAAELAQYLIAEFVEDRTDAVYLIYNEFVSVLRQRLVVEPLLPIGGLTFRGGAERRSYREAARAYAEARTGGNGEGFGAIGTVASEAGESMHEAAEFGGTQGEPVEMVEFIYEPGPAEILEALLPRFVETGVYQALLESTAAEHAARMAAMDNATKNAEELIENLTLTMNKIRQEVITTEILEVVGGAEALA
jgi:F-type H+-transporting ATPase subunit gamma